MSGINKIRIRLLCVLCIAAIFVTGCSFGKVELDNKYDVFQSIAQKETALGNSFFAEDLCVTKNTNFGTDKTDSQVAEGAGVFNLDTKEVMYSQNLFAKLYPASTTKVLTAYIILENCDLDDMVTVSEEAVSNMEDSSICGINAGDVLSVRQLLYGLMLVSGNDAANALAEYYSGSIEAFAEVMNEEALKIGATNSHFMNPHGLSHDDHYTCVYDMYLIMNHAISNKEFVSLINTTSYDAVYSNREGGTVEKTWLNTNRYLIGEYDAPEGITVVGGKTGTTHAAGYCLVLYSTNEKDERIISIVYKADCRSNLYLLMNQILSQFAK